MRFSAAPMTPFRNLPYRFVVTTANQVSEETARMAPANFRLCTYAPGSKLLEKCRAMIFHGGNGSMYQVLAAGVPMLALPSHQEQGLITNFAVDRGYCIRMHARWFRTNALINNLRELIDNQNTAKQQNVTRRMCAQRTAQLTPPICSSASPAMQNLRDTR